MKLRDILGVLRDAYCRRVGVEYMHIIDPEERAWIQQHIEVKNDAPTREEQKHILSRLNVAEAFETFLQTKYVGQKRFSLEGGETVIALLDAVLAAAAGHGLDEVVIGMPHRGRLNVLANIVGKPYAKIFNEFEGNIDPGTAQGSGDVKYHLGAHGTYSHPDGDRDRRRADREPLPPGGGQPGARGNRPRQAGHSRQGRGRLHRAAGADARRRRVRRPGRGRRDAEPVPAARLPHRRHRARRRQQPGRLHHLAGPVPLEPVLHRHRADDRRRRSSTSTATTPRPASGWPSWRWTTGRRSRRTSSSTWSATAGAATTRRDNPSFTQPLMYDIIDNKRSVRKLYTEALIGRGDITMADAEEALKDFQAQLEKVFARDPRRHRQAAPEPVMDDRARPAARRRPRSRPR